jgi:hypothetical protein
MVLIYNKSRTHSKDFRHEHNKHSHSLLCRSLDCPRRVSRGSPARQTVCTRSGLQAPRKGCMITLSIKLTTYLTLWFKTDHSKVSLLAGTLGTLTDVVPGSPQSKANDRSVPRMNRGRFLPNPFHFIIHCTFSR